MKREERNHILTLLFTGIKSGDIPVLTTFNAPRDTQKFLAFYEAYRASGWNYSEAIAPYQLDQLTAFNLHYNETTGEYSYSVSQHKSFHVKYGTE